MRWTLLMIHTQMDIDMDMLVASKMITDVKKTICNLHRIVTQKNDKLPMASPHFFFFPFGLVFHLQFHNLHIVGHCDGKECVSIFVCVKTNLKRLSECKVFFRCFCCFYWWRNALATLANVIMHGDLSLPRMKLINKTIE